MTILTERVPLSVLQPALQEMVTVPICETGAGPPMGEVDTVPKTGVMTTGEVDWVPPEPAQPKLQETVSVPLTVVC